MEERVKELEQAVAALIESNDMLQEEVTRLRASNRMLRTIHRALRAKVTSQAEQLEQAKFNDEAFKSFCEMEIGAEVVPAEGGLPKAENGGTAGLERQESVNTYFD
jgi:regulator of replication initiation timing